jgi:hypothetical protein
MRRASLVGVSLALLALTGGAGCATAGHQTPDDIDAAAMTLDGSAPGVQAPGAIGVALFGYACDGGAARVDPSPMRRISRVEYDNMVRDLLLDTTRPATAFPPESPLTSGVNFQANTYTSSSALIVQDYAQAAESLAATAVSNATTLAAILPCQTHDISCAKQFIETWANRAFRGQLDSTAETMLVQLFTDASTQFDFATGIQAVIMAVLESPRFLFVVEAGGGGDGGGAALPLSSYEVAARLALFLWRSVPDDTLMQAAAQGQLATAAQVRAQATRMLGDPKAADALADFTTQWMQLQSTPTLGKDTQFTAWTNGGDPKLGQELVDETITNVTEAFDGGTLTDLLTSPSSYINSKLAMFYSAGGGNDGGITVAFGSAPSTTVADTTITDRTFVRTALPHRAGILTNGSVLATQAHTSLPSAVLRGKLVREQVLCDAIKPPPPGIPAPATSVADGGTTRSALEAHLTQTSCVMCHQYMDNIGLGFGFFDAIGEYQTSDANGFGAPPGGFPAIDATGQVLPMTTGELSTRFDGATDLATKLASATQTRQCFVLQELRYALSRVESAADTCSASAVYQEFAAGGFDLRKLLVAIAASDAFRYKSAGAGGGCQ